MPGDAIERTLAPIELERFLADHWDRQPLVVQRGEGARFDGILSREDVQRLVCETGIRTPAFRLVRDGSQVSLRDYTEDVRWHPSSFTGLARVDRVAEEFDRGATIVLQALHLHWLPAARYCRALEEVFGCPVQANAYLTPAAAQGFSVHHDTHDVFVLQVAGTKRWRWFQPLRELPLRGQRWSAELGDPGEPVAELELAAGDTLYLPRGWPHEAFTSETDSLHLTIGLHPATRLDALRAALESCGEEVEFRRALSADGKLPEDLLARLQARLEPEAVARRMRRRFLAGRRPILDGQLAQVGALARLSATDQVERRATALAELELGESEAVLVLEGKEVRFPAVAGAAVAAAHAARGPFSAADLPGPLDEAGRLVLVRRLVREGYLHLRA
jgi:ribosomal protein L16 Arg81 hydroxylase